MRVDAGCCLSDYCQFVGIYSSPVFLSIELPVWLLFGVSLNVDLNTIFSSIFHAICFRCFCLLRLVLNRMFRWVSWLVCVSVVNCFLACSTCTCRFTLTWVPVCIPMLTAAIGMNTCKLMFTNIYYPLIDIQAHTLWVWMQLKTWLSAVSMLWESLMKHFKYSAISEWNCFAANDLAFSHLK